MLFQILKADFLQRTRSYNYLVTLVVCLFLSFQIVPPPDANYATIDINSMKVLNNAAWIGTSVAILINAFMIIFAFYLINSTIERDRTTGVGQIIATTPISNLSYLFLKVLSNFLILSTLVVGGMFASLVLLFWRGEDQTLDLWNLWNPFFFFTFPSMFFVACWGVTFEVIFGSRQSLANIVYFIFAMFMVSSVTTDWVDVAGMDTFQAAMKKFMWENYQIKIKTPAIGILEVDLSNKIVVKWTGFSFSLFEIAKQLLSVLFVSLLPVYLSSFVFHRFETASSPSFGFKKKQNSAEIQEIPNAKPHFSVKDLPSVSYNFSIFPLFVAELKILLKGKSIWWLLLTAGLWIATIFAPFSIALVGLLPILMLVQTARLSDLGLKETLYETDLYVFSSYQPLFRLLIARWTAAFSWLLLLCLPIMCRSVWEGQAQNVAYIASGALFLVLLGFTMSAWVRNSKFFEIVFLMIIYMVLNQVAFADFMSLFPQSQEGGMPLQVLIANLILIVLGILGRKRQMIH